MAFCEKTNTHIILNSKSAMNPFKNNMNSSYFLFASCRACFARGFQYILDLIDNEIVNFNMFCGE